MVANLTEKLTSQLIHPRRRDADGRLTYRAVPYPTGSSEGRGKPTWRIELASVEDPSRRLGLEVNGEIILGRTNEVAAGGNLVDLTPLGAAAAGVSRQHAIMRPTATNLYVADLASTNGTLRNGRSIGRRAPYALVDGDVISLGQLRLFVRIVDRPSWSEEAVDRQLSLAEAMSHIAKAITSQLDLDDVLNQVADNARSLTAAGETGIWLVDERSGELFLEAARGITDDRIKRMRLPSRPDSLVGKVLRTAESVRVERQPGEEEIKLGTGYLVEAIVYVPITLGGVTFGVLSAAHRESGRNFSQRDEQLLEAIADFAAIAIQNARLFQSTDQALAHRVKELAALNQLAYTLSASLDLEEVYTVLVDQVNRYWPVEAVHLYLLKEADQSLVPYEHHVGSNPTAQIPVGRGIIGRVAATREVVISDSPADIEEYDAAYDSLGGKGPASVACVPLQVQERTVGVLALYNKVDGSFTEDDATRLQAFASPVATAVENARLFAKSEQRHAAILATATTLPQPLMIIGEDGDLIVTNDAANRILKGHMPQLFKGISAGIGRTIEIEVDGATFLTTTEHVRGVGTIIVMQDISYVKSLERERSELMHTISHDMKGPLTSITGYAHLLQKKVPDDPMIAQFLSQITTAADRMLDMVKQMLAMVDDASALQMVKEPVDLRALVGRVVSDLGGAAAAKNMSLSSATAGSPYPIEGDERRLYHAVLNLVDNAIKYSPRNTEVRVGLVYKDEHVVVAVQDEGPGIDPDDMPFIFEKYYRGGGAVSHEGTGIGLAAVRRIVEAHDALVTATNRPDGGSEFRIVFPKALRVEAVN